MSLSALSSAVPSHPTQVSPAPRWGAWSAILIVGCFYLTQAVGMLGTEFLVGIGVGFVESSIGDKQGILAKQTLSWLLPFSILVGTVSGGVLSLKVASRRAKPSMDFDWFWDLMGKSCDLWSLWRFVLLGLGLGFGFFVLAGYGVSPPDDLPQPIFDAMLTAPLLLQIVWVLMFVVFFPVVEEVLFRGFLFTGLAQSWGPSLAGVLTTAAFVAVHMPKVLEYWPALLAVTLIGTLTVLIRIRTRSLAPGIALHSTYNGVLVTAAFLTQPVS